MPADAVPRHPIEELAEEFAQRYRRGERPELSEYTLRHPELADEIRELFPALVFLEQCQPQPSSRTPSPAVECTPHRQLGDYRLVREVGRGGMGVVYEAVQGSLGRRVALKVMPCGALADSVRLGRFEREARAAARLHHTNIIPVFAVGECDGTPYYAMQFIDGCGLDVVLNELRRDRTPPATLATHSPTHREGSTAAPDGIVANHAVVPVPPVSCPAVFGVYGTKAYDRAVARLGAQAADALAHAHARGVLHRDVKPSNFLLDEHGTVWISDFGLARAEGLDDLTGTGDVVGTLRYLAPERLEGVTDARGDVYGLGLVLYELLLLRPAFDATNRGELLRQVGRAEPPRPRRLRPRLARDLETVILKAIAPVPDQRYASAAELAEDLRAFVADRPVRARRISPLGLAWRWCRRNPGWAAAFASVLLLLSLLAGGASVAALWLDQEQLATRDQLTKTVAAEREARTRLVEARLAQARAARWSGRVGQRFESLQALEEAAQTVRALGLGQEHLRPLRDEAMACLALVDVRPTGRRLALSAREGLAAWGESHFAVTSPDGIRVCDAADGRELARLPDQENESRGGWFCGGGGRLALKYTGGQPAGSYAQIWDWQSGRPLLGTKPVPGILQPLSLDASQALLLRNRELVVVDLATGQEVRRITAPAAATSAAVRPDGSQVVLANWTSPHVHLCATANGALARTWILPEGVWQVAWHPTGRLVAVASGPNVHLFDPVTGEEQALLRGHHGRVVQLAFTRSGDVLQTQSWDRTSRYWDPWSGRQLLSTPVMTALPNWDERQPLVASESGALALWEIDLAREYRLLPFAAGTRTFHHQADASPDGRWYAVGGKQGFQLWDLTTGAVESVSIGETRGLAFHPDGGWLFTASKAGVHRWPVQRLPDVIAIGPPEQLPTVAQSQRVAVCGGLLAVTGSSGVQLVRLTEPPTAGAFLKHPVAWAVSFSPDGRYVATGTYNGRGVRVWSVDGGRLEQELLPDTDIAAVAFTPDGRSLLTITSSSSDLWEIGTWTRHRQLPADRGVYNASFSGDGRLSVTALAPTAATLCNLGFDRSLATFSPPHTEPIVDVHLTPDGTRLVLSTGNPGRLQVLDLRAVRAQLAKLDLDWDALPYPSAVPGDPEPHLVAHKVRVRTNLGSLAQGAGKSNGVPATTRESDRAGDAVRRSREAFDLRAGIARSAPSDKAFADLEKSHRAYVNAVRRLEPAAAAAAYRHAIKTLEPLVKTHPTAASPQAALATAYLRHGMLHRASNRLQDAHASYDRALQLLEPLVRDHKDVAAYRGDLALVHLHRAYAHISKVAYDKAVPELNHCLTLAPEDHEACQALSWILLWGRAAPRETARALALAHKAVAKSPKNTDYLTNLAVAHLRSSEYRQAAQVAARSINVNRANTDRERSLLASAHLVAALASARLGEGERARTCLAAARALCELPAKLPASKRHMMESLRAEAEALLDPEAGNPAGASPGGAAKPSP